jgi:hypothetical protein
MEAESLLVIINAQKATQQTETQQITYVFLVILLAQPVWTMGRLGINSNVLLAILVTNCIMNPQFKHALALAVLAIMK